MSKVPEFRGVYPIGDTDPQALPVKDVDSAIGYYTRVLGFSVVSRSPEAAVLERDRVRIGLARNGADPDQASCYFDVANAEALRAELEACGIAPSPFRLDEQDDGTYRIFFAREPYGVCFCFGEPAGKNAGKPD